MVQFFDTNNLKCLSTTWGQTSNKFYFRDLYLSPTISRGKLLVSGLTNIVYNLQARCVHSISPTTYPFLFVSPKSVLSRDILRSSGYRIVRDQNKASAIVIPRIREKDVTEYKCNVIALQKSGEDITGVCLISVDNVGERTATESDVANMLASIKELGYTDILIDGFHEMSVFFTPKVEEIKGALNTSKYDDDAPRYCMDTDVQTVPSIEVSPELFELWDRCDESNVVYDSLLQTDWKSYPTTFAVMLNVISVGFYGCPNRTDLILREIGFWNYNRAGTLGNTIVQPDDWNMLQKCLLRRAGLPENGGYKYHRPNDRADKLVRTRIAIRPLYIDEPQSFDNLLEMVRNS